MSFRLLAALAAASFALVACGKVKATEVDGSTGAVDAPAVDAPAVDGPTVDAPTDGSTTSTVTVMLGGTGVGSVASTTAGISCPTDCSETYDSGTMVTLTARPGGGSTFIGWSGGGCSGTGSCALTVSAATTVTARFDEGRLGNVTPLGQTSTPSENFLLGERLVVPTSLTLKRFAVLSLAAGAQMQMALYRDNGAGAPGNLVAQTAISTMVNGPTELPPTAGPVALAAGTYWIMAIYGPGASISYTVNAPTNVVHYIPLTFGSVPPNPFPAPMTYMGQSFNYYIVTQ